MDWEVEFARTLRAMTEKTKGAPAILEGTVVATSPLKLSFWDGEVMAPPMKLDCVVGAQGVYRDKDNGHLYLEKWKVGDRAVCCLMGQTVVILGRLGGTAWAIPVR